MVNTYYTGIGSRSTPKNVLQTMEEIGEFLAKLGYGLRSGHAEGADTAFENGSKRVEGFEERDQIFLPWPNFNGSKSPFNSVSKNALEIAEKLHPNWGACSSAAMKFHGRNSYQVLGPDLKTPSKFVICYTPNGLGSGGTGQALRIAKNYNVPILDLGKSTEKRKDQLFMDFITEILENDTKPDRQ